MKCRTCLRGLGLSSGVPIKSTKLSVGKTIQEIIDPFIPQMIDSKLIGDLVCSDCIDILQIFVKFIERCTIVEEYLKERDLLNQYKRDLKQLLGESKHLIEKSENQYVRKSIVNNNKEEHRDPESVKENFKKKIGERFKNILSIEPPETIHKPLDGPPPRTYSLVNKSPLQTPMQQVEERVTSSSQKPVENDSSDCTENEPRIVEIASGISQSQTTIHENVISNVNLENTSLAKSTDDSLCDININSSHDRIVVMTKTHEEIDTFLNNSSINKVDIINMQSDQNKTTKRIVFLGRAYDHCPVCKAEFYHSQGLSRHLQKAHVGVFPGAVGESPVGSVLHNQMGICFKQCPACRVHFGSPSLMKKHLREVHKDYQPFKCEFCGVTFKQPHLYNNHIRNYKMFRTCNGRTCLICRKRVSVTEFKAHRETHRIHKCDKCRKKFLYKINLKNHRFVHQEGHPKNDESKALCDICGKITSAGHGVKHRLLCHSDARNFLCDRCSKTFKTKVGLTKHLKMVHEPLQFLECPICHKKTKEQSGLKFHMRLKHSTSYSIVCHICGKGFIRDDYYKRHIKQHYFKYRPGVRKYRFHQYEKMEVTCKFCGKKQKSIHLLRIHLLSAHLNNARFKCQYCDMTFKNKISVRLHEKRHQDPIRFELTCKVCWKICSNKENLEAHSLKHKDSRRRKCDICNETFPSKFLLENHKGAAHFDRELIEQQKTQLLCEGLSDFILTNEELSS